MGDECVKVVVRCRPMNRREKELKCGKCVVVDQQRLQIQINKTDDGGEEVSKRFTFDGVYDDDSRQQDIYQDTAYSLVESVIDGYNGTIFAYGQTGCGKTFTMEGVPSDPELRGIIPNTFEQIFSQISQNRDAQTQFLVSAAYIEIYNEEVRDLLGADSKAKLDLKEDKDRGVFVKGLTQNVVKSVEQISQLMDKGNSNRTTGFTLMNADSSRSHSIFMVSIETCEPVEPGSDDTRIKAGKLNLVDLAGSERQSKTQASGTRLKEATKINLSLSALGNVISALVSGKGRHIPYRDSKLTRLLQDSLGGNTKTIMIAAISPADNNFDETMSTLRYANRAKNIKNKPTVNEDPKDALLREYQDEITRLKNLLKERNISLDGTPGGAPAITQQAPAAPAAPAPRPPQTQPQTKDNHRPPPIQASNNSDAHLQVQGGDGDEDDSPQVTIDVVSPGKAPKSKTPKAAQVSRRSPRNVAVKPSKGEPADQQGGITTVQVNGKPAQGGAVRVEVGGKGVNMKPTPPPDGPNQGQNPRNPRGNRVPLNADNSPAGDQEAQQKVQERIRKLAADQLAHEQRALELAAKLTEAQHAAPGKEMAKDLAQRLQEQQNHHHRLAADLAKQIEVERAQQDAPRDGEGQQDPAEAQRRLKEMQAAIMGVEEREKAMEGVKLELQAERAKRQADVHKAHMLRQEQLQRERELREAKEKQAEKAMFLEEKYSSVADELQGKTKKLKRIRKRYKELQNDLRDQVQEAENEKEDFMTNIRELTRESLLYQRICQRFLEQVDIDRIVAESAFDEDLGDWRLPTIELPTMLPKVGGKWGMSERENDGRGGGGRNGRFGATNRFNRTRAPPRMNARQSADSGWAKSIRSNDFSVDVRPPSPPRQSKIDQPARLNPLGGGSVDMGPAMRSRSASIRMSGGGAPRRTDHPAAHLSVNTDKKDRKFSRSVGKGKKKSKERRATSPRTSTDVRSMSPTSLAHYQELQAAMGQGGGGANLELPSSMQVPRTRPNFEPAQLSANNSPRGSGAGVFASMNQIPKRANFQPADVPGESPANSSGVGDDLQRRAPFQARAPDPNGGSGFDIDASTQGLPRRQHFGGSPQDGYGHNGSSAIDDTLRSTEHIPKRAAFQPSGKRSSVPLADSAGLSQAEFASMDFPPARASFRPALGTDQAQPDEGSADALLNMAIPSRPSFRPQGPLSAKNSGGYSQQHVAASGTLSDGAGSDEDHPPSAALGYSIARKPRFQPDVSLIQAGSAPDGGGGGGGGGALDVQLPSRPAFDPGNSRLKLRV